MKDYSEVIEREYIISEIELYIENAALERLRQIKEFIEKLPA